MINGGLKFKMYYKSNLHRNLSKSNFVITAEIGPPKGSDPNIIIDKSKILKNYADAFNITDNQTAVVRMSSLSASKILIDQKIEPIMQITCRDRNRIAIQSDLLGASALGIKNILCLTGDHQSFGNHPEAKGVFDIDSIQLIKIVKNMSDKGIFQNGELIKFKKPEFYIGAATNPFSDLTKFFVDRLDKKIEAGVEFIQTQSVFNIDKFNYWMDEVRSRGIDNQVHIIAGITPLKSKKMADRMKFHVPGVNLPDDIYKRMEKSDDASKEGFEISLELINKIKKIKGVHGIHITALFWENIIPDLIIDSKLIKDDRFVSN
jgi:methylenetetrahydrofolate reductase (NADPH)